MKKRKAKVQRGPISRGSGSLGTSRYRYVASRKLAEEVREATNKAVSKVKNKRKQIEGEMIEINPEKDIVGQGVHQQC